MKATLVLRAAIAVWILLNSVLAADRPASPPASAPPGRYQVTWVGNSFPGASNRWVQNFFIHTNVHPNSLGTRDKVGRLWKLHVDYTDPAHQEWEFVPKGITAFKRSSGEYLIFVEENYKAKSLIYRWMP